eukprot:5349152-Pyramimonas_sp.AAC.1
MAERTERVDVEIKDMADRLEAMEAADKQARAIAEAVAEKSRSCCPVGQPKSIDGGGSARSRTQGCRGTRRRIDVGGQRWDSGTAAGMRAHVGAAECTADESAALLRPGRGEVNGPRQRECAVALESNAASARAVAEATEASLRTQTVEREANAKLGA